MIGVRVVAHAVAAAAVLCTVSGIASAQTKPPVEAFAVLPPEYPEISPDGTRFALIRDVGGRPSVAIYKMAAPEEPPQIVTSANWIIAGMRWVKNDVLMIYSKRNAKVGVYDRYKSDILRPMGDAAAGWLKDGKLVELTSAVEIVDIDLANPDTIYGTYQSSLYAVNLGKGGPPQPFIKHYIGAAKEYANQWFMDGHGKVLARVDWIQDKESFDNPLWHATLKVQQNDVWHPLGTYDVTVDQGDGVAGISEDGNSIIRLAPDATATMSLDRIDIATGAETKLYQDPVYDVTDTLEDEWTGRIIGYKIVEDMPVYRYFDPRRQALQTGLEQAFPGLSVHAVSSDLAGDKVIVEAVGPRMPPSYYLFDRSTHRATAIAASYTDLSESDLGEVKPYGYAARDGLHIAAYLTLPPGRKPQNLPLVVMPHGGPDARDDMGFDFLREFLANRGYAVLQPNYRGSQGYGRAFTKAGLHQWGLKMQDDISDGVKKTIADGIAGPKRICIFGASYGGYAALAGATLTPDLYACAISFEGPSNLLDMLGYSKRQFQMDLTHGSYWTTRMGDAFSDTAQLNAASPALHADRVRAPILLLHSELDVTVPIEQSEMMDAALTNAGKQVQFVRIAGDDHYMSLESTRLRVLLEVEKFLAANIGS